MSTNIGTLSSPSASDGPSHGGSPHTQATTISPTATRNADFMSDMIHGLSLDGGRFHLETTMTGPHENIVHQSIGTLQREVVAKTVNDQENKVTYSFTNKDLADLARERIQRLIQFGFVSGVVTSTWRVKYVRSPTDSVAGAAYGAQSMGGPVQPMTTTAGQGAAFNGQAFPPVPAHLVLPSRPANLNSGSATTSWPAGLTASNPSVVQTPMYLPPGQYAITMLFQADALAINVLDVATIGSTIW
ncbi:hypothetical protein LTS18_010365, partial [Coniosporium uncinatum]